MVLKLGNLFTIVSPVITKFTGETIEVSDILDLDKYVEEAEDVGVQNTVQSNNQIMEVYSSGIQEDLKAKIEAKGYMVNSIDIGIANDESYSITDITIDVEKEEKVDGNEMVENEENMGEADSTNKVEPIENVSKVEISIAGDSTNSNKDSNEDSLSNSEKKELKEYLSSVYEVNENNIIIN